MERGGRLRCVACAAILSLAQCACVVQSQYEGGALVSRTVGLGPARLPDCEGSRSTLVTTSALGLGIGRGGLALGAMRAERACIPMECKAVFWVKDPAIVEEVRKRVGEDAHMCVIGREGGT